MQNRFRRPSSRPQNRARGFTLIELMIGVAVVAIIAAVAMPTFMDSIRKGRRSEAFAAMASVQQAQERWRSSHATYAGSLTELNMSSISPTASGNYQIATSAAAGALASTGYTVTAEGIAGSQVNDAQCRKLSVQVSAGTVKYAGCGSCSSFTYNVQDPCWKQ